jgi:hypothetical protein
MINEGINNLNNIQNSEKQGGWAFKSPYLTLKNKDRRLVLRNEAQYGTVCWASQAQRQPTMRILQSFSRLMG